MKQLALLFSLVLFSTLTAFADVQVYCDATIPECVDKTTYGLMKLNCRLDAVNCEDVAIDGVSSVACLAISENCTEPSAELFGFTSAATKCFGSTKKSLKKADSALYLTWTMGLLQSYVRDICVGE